MQLTLRSRHPVNVIGLSKGDYGLMAHSVVDYIRS